MLGAVVIAWAISRAIDGESWSAIVDSLPSIARHAQQKRITTFSASLAARLEIALKIVRNADGNRIRQRTALPGRWRRYQHY
ncbi:hypothetical protein OIU92_00450 [Escherichia coli]|nr:hypothetical protein [Escherichia coli]